MSTTVPNQAALELKAAKAPAAKARISRRGGFLDKYFYFGMSLLIVAVVVYGFSHTVGGNLLHPHEPRPLLLWFHAAVFSSWLIFFTLQSGLVRARKVRLHRTLGWFGAGLGVAIIVFGYAISFVMARYKQTVLHDTDGWRYILIPLLDITCFTVVFSMAIGWRKKPEFHRRLILIASCALTAAAWGRFPSYLLPGPVFYGGVDLLILLGVARDWLVDRRVHPVYRYALPPVIAAQVAVTYIVVANPGWWIRIAQALGS